MANSAVSKKKYPVYLILSVIAIEVMTAPSFSGSLNPLYLVAFFAISCGCSAWLFFNTGYIWGILGSVLAFGISTLIGGSYISALAALALIPCGITYSLVSKRYYSRSFAMGISSAATAVIAMLSLFLNIYTKTGVFDLSAAKVVYSSFFAKLTDALASSFTVTVAGQSIPFVTAANREAYINLVISLIPGLIVTASSFSVFFGGLVYKLLLSMTGSEPPERSDWKMLPMPISAAFFCVSALLVFTAGSYMTLWLSAINVMLILFPGFFLSGWSSLSDVRIVDGFPRPRILRTVLMIFAGLTGITGFIIMPCCFGVYDSISAVIPKKTIKISK